MSLRRVLALLLLLPLTVVDAGAQTSGLTVILGVDPVRPTAGQQVEVRMVVLNLGAEAVSNVSVELLSEFGGSLAFQGFETESGSFNSNTFVWSAGNVNVGASREGTLTATWTGMNPADVFTARVVGSPESNAVKGVIQRDYGTDGGHSLALDGVDDFVRIPDSNPLDVTSTFTLMTWVRPDAGANGTLISHDVDNEDTSGSYTLSVNGSGVSYETNNQGSVSATDVLDAGEWNHIAVSFNEQDSPNARLYVNGALVATADAAAPSATTGDVLLGRRGIPDAFFDGRLDETSIWNVALQAADIRSRMMAPLGGDETGLVAYYRFDEDGALGATVVDASGQGHDGAVENGATWVDNAPPIKGAPNLDIAIDSDVTRAADGDAIAFTVTVTNKGPALTGLELDHFLRRGRADFVSAVPGAGTYDAPGAKWTLADMQRGDQETLQINMESDEDRSLLVLAVDAARAHQSRSDGSLISGSFTGFRTILPILTGQGTAVALDGTDDHIVVLGADLLDSPEELTVEAWVNVSGGNHAALFTRTDPGAFETGAYGINLLSDGRIEWDVRDFGYTASAAGVISRDTWHHVAVTYKESANPRLVMYVDGNPVHTANAGDGGGSIQPTVGERGLVIGSRGTDLFLQGHIDDFAYWRKARTAEQIQESMTGALLGNEDGLALLHRYELKRNLSVNNDGADDAQDHSGNDLHGDLQEGADLAAVIMPKLPTSVLASDDFYEDRVEVSWTLPDDSDATLVRVLRNGQLLDVVSSQTEVYTDAAGSPNAIHVYCVVTETSAGVRSTLGCDGGRRRLIKPDAVEASTDLYEDRVTVLWSDRSVWNTGYQVTRDDVQVANLGGNTEVFNDLNAENGVEYTYCVVPTQDGLEGNEKTCVTGRRANTLPPVQVAATDGIIPQLVRVSWMDVGEGATGFEIRRDGTLLATVLADDRSWDDLQPVSGVVHSYCVRRLVGAEASIDICDDGSINTLSAPSNAVASNDLFDDRIEVTWNDRTDHETGYRVYREGGAALEFDGTDDVIEVPAETAFDRTTMTFEAWLRPTAFGAIRSVVDKGGDPRNFDVLLLGGGELHFAAHSQTCAEFQSLNSAQPLALNEWSHVAVVMTPTAATMYVNGIESATRSLAGVCVTPNPVRLGGGRFNGFAGTMDEVRLWSVARSRADVRTGMFSRLVGSESGLVAYWPLDEGTGSRAADAFGIHSGALSGFELSDDVPGWTIETAPFSQHGTGLALVLDGEDDQVRVADTPALDLETFTLETWVNPEVSIDRQLLIGKTAVDGSARNYALERMENGHLRLSMNPAVCSDPLLPILESTGPLAPGRWTHLAVTYDGTTAILYVNGAKDREVAAAGPICQNADLLLIGGGPQGFFEGQLDRTRIWNASRTNQEILDYMHATVPTGVDGLVIELEYDARTGNGDGVDGFQGLSASGLVNVSSVELEGNPAFTKGRSALLGQTSADRGDYVDVNALPDVMYTYCMAAYTSQGVETSTACASGRRSPAIGPENLRATDKAFEDRVELSWVNPSSRTSVFKVYRDDVLIKTLPVTTLTLTDSGIPSDTALEYCVTGVSPEGIESSRACDEGSRSLKVATDVQASDGQFEGRVDITWVDNSEIERGYRVYRREVLNNSTGALAADSSLVAETVASQAEATDRGGVPGTRYRYSVVAFDKDGFSRIASAVGMRRLLTPASVAASDAETETSIRVTWDDRSRIERGYRIFRDDVELATVDKNVAAYVDQNPPFGVEFTYSVEAFDDLGPSARNSDTGSTTLLPPGTVSASTSWTDRVSITWVDQSAVEDGYRITKNGTQIAEVAMNVTSYEDMTPSVNSADTYCVMTLKDGSTSNAECSIGFAFVPEPPPDFIPLNNALAPEDGSSGDEFGFEVATAGNQMLIGAWFHKDDTGAVYVYERQSSGWVFRQKLIASDSKPGARFGQSISMTPTWAVIGSPNHENDYGSESSSVGLSEGTVSNFGRIYYFKRTPDGWEERQAQTHHNLNLNAQYGAAISTDGNFSLILSPGDGTGSLYIQRRNGDTWEAADSKGHLPGTAAAIEDEFAVFSADQQTGVGFARVIQRTGDTWNLGVNLTPVAEADNGSSFGKAASISEGVLAVSAHTEIVDGHPNHGAVYLFDLVSGNDVPQRQRIVPTPRRPHGLFGKDVSLRGGRLLVGANEVSYLFERDENGQFVQTQVFRNGENPSSVDFGRSVSISQEGVIVIGDPREIGGSHGNTPTAGKIFFQEASPASPGNVVASNGAFQNRVELSWEDRSENEDGFRIFRDNELIEVTGADVTSFNDVNAVPGNVHEYCVQSLRAVYEDVSEKICDIGWRFPDGAIAGKVANNLAAAAQDIEVCLTPTPNGSLSLDGFQGEAKSLDSTTLPSSFTIEFWVKRSDGTTGKDIAFSHGTPGQNTGLIAGFRADDTFTFGFFLNDLNGPAITDVRWHHFALTYNSSTGQRAIIHNGVEVASDNSVAYAGNGPFYLGSQHGSDHFNGQIDEVRVWDHVVPIGTINARMHETIDARLPNLGIFAHWSLDERDGDYSANDVDTSGSYYLRHNGGVNPARPGAPLRACDITDKNGDYSFTGIRYGESTEFTLNPQDPGDIVRTFSPTRRLLSLNRQNPVQNEVPFTDLTKHTVAGVVQFDGTECPVTDALFAVRTGESQAGGPFQSDEDGDYSVAADPGNVTVEPSVSGDPTRIFSPDILSFPDLDGDVYEQNLVDLTTRTLSGQVVGTGMCRLPIGVATLEIRAQNGCMTREVVTDADGNYSVDLPPMKYTVQLKSIANDNAVQRVDIEEFFEEQGAQIVDLSEGATEHDLIYRPGLKVQIAGLEPSMCNTSQIPGNTPILTKGEKVNLTITVVEDLGDAGVCPVEAGTVTLFSEISDQTNDPMTFEIAEDSGGKIDTTIVVGQPNILQGRVVDGVDRTFQKFITASADVDGVLGESTEWAFVEGVRARPGGRFATAPDTPIPTWILRDPPGDGSYSYIEEGSETCNIFSGEASFGGAVTVHAQLDAGVVADAGVAFGGEATVEFEGVNVVGGSFTVSVRQTLGGGTEVCTRANTRIQTSPEPDFTGPDADVFVGAGVNFIFAKADIVDIDENECTVDLDDTIAFGPELETGFVFTREHIENRLIPDLGELAEATSPDSAAIFNAAVRNWDRMLSDSKKTLESDDLKPFEEDRRNRSFNAGANFGYEKSRSEASTFFTETELEFAASAWFSVRAGAAGSVVDVGAQADLFVSGLFRFETVSTNETIYGYELSDDDQGDNFTVDILEDPSYKTPAFDVKAGLSSCPYEPWMGVPLVVAGDADPTQIAPRMTPRDLPELSMNPIQRLGLDPNTPALFTVNLGNASGSDEERDYRLGMLTSSNPGGAVLQAAGSSLGTLDFSIPAGEVHQTQLSVTRGPEKYNYPRLGLRMYPICDEGSFAQADTLFFDVSYTPPCSDISIFRPKVNWTLNRETVSDPMEIILNDFTLAENDVDAGVKRIGFEYRKKGTSDWLPGASYDRATIIDQGGPDADSFIADWTFPAEDGEYEIRAWTECDSGKNYSDVVVGRVDTVLPEILKAPEPADGVLHFGDDIAVTLNEDVLCSSIITGGQNPNTFLRRTDNGEAIPIQAVCDGRVAVLSPQAPDAFDALEGLDLEVSMSGWTDLTGNPLEETATWEFEVRRSAFTWSPLATAATVKLGTTGAFEATLTNGKTNESVTYALVSADSWLVPNVLEGTLPAASQATIDFTLQNLPGVGQHETTVTATSGTGQSTVLTVTVDVYDECVAPSWNVDPTAFEHNMTLTAQMYVEGVVSKDENDRLAAFVGDQIRGVAPVVPFDANNDDVPDGNRVNMVIYSNQASGEQVRFRAFDASECATFETSSLTLTFDAAAVHGTPQQPITLQAPAPEAVPGSVALNSGWTWFSINVVPDDTRISALLANVPATEANIVKSQRHFSLFDPSAGWVGTLADIDPRSGYLIKLNQSHNLGMVGAPVDVAGTPVDVVPGWNWIGYLPQQALDVNEALESLTPTTNDIIKSQFAFAQYVEGSGWIGSLTSMEPGLGYQIRVAAADAIVYPDAGPPPALAMQSPDTLEPLRLNVAKVDRISKADVDDSAPAREEEHLGTTETAAAEQATAPTLRLHASDNMECSVNPADYQYSLTLTATVSVDGEEIRSADHELAGFVTTDSGFDCRGVGRLQYIESLDRYLAFVVLYANTEGEAIDLNVFDPSTGLVLTTDKVLSFASNGVFGSVQNPIPVDASTGMATSTEDVTLPTDFGLDTNYPNPFSGMTTIGYAVPRTEVVQISIYDVLGRRVAILKDGEQAPGRYEVRFDAGRLAPGTYIYRMKAGAWEETRLMVLTR